MSDPAGPPILPVVVTKPTDLILCPKGTKDWGAIPIEVERATSGAVRALPIRLFHGEHWRANKGWGKVHIHAEHEQEFRHCGFNVFVVEAISTYTQIYLQRDKVVVLFRGATGRLQAVLEARYDCYSIVTVFRPAPTKRIQGDLVWKK